MIDNRSLPYCLPGCRNFSPTHSWRASLKPHLPCVQQGLMKYPADISMASVTNRRAPLLALRERRPKTSNILNDELLRLERRGAATITAGMMTLSKHVNNKAFSDMSSDMMFEKFVRVFFFKNWLVFFAWPFPTGQKDCVYRPMNWHQRLLNVT